jgi:hypothetical protein
MDFLTLLAGTTVAINPLVVVTWSMLIYLMRSVSKSREQIHDQISDLNKQLAVVLANQGHLMRSYDTLEKGQKQMLATMNRQHAQNIRTLFRRGLGVPGLPENELGESQAGLSADD